MTDKNSQKWLYSLMPKNRVTDDHSQTDKTDDVTEQHSYFILK